jgi:hypothetical protein
MFYPWIDNSVKLMDVLLQLQPDSKAIWGRMDSQQMIEHLILVCEISNGSKEAEILTPEKYIEKSQAFLMCDEPMPKNFVAKFIPEEPIAHRYDDLQSAIQAFLSSLSLYHSYWEGKKGSTRNHPVFGKLNKKMWNRVHNKHITHHLLQFGLSN